MEVHHEVHHKVKLAADEFYKVTTLRRQIIFSPDGLHKLKSAADGSIELVQDVLDAKLGGPDSSYLPIIYGLLAAQCLHQIRNWTDLHDFTLLASRNIYLVIVVGIVLNFDAIYSAFASILCFCQQNLLESQLRGRVF